MEKEYINNELDLDNDRSKNYREIYTFLDNYTDGFTLNSGSLPFKDKSEAKNAEVILNKYYNNVERQGLDYERAEIDGVDYVVQFNSPKDIDEDFASGDELKYMPNKAPTAGPLAGGGMGEDLDLDERLYLDKKRKALANAGFNVEGLCAEEILNLYQDLLGIAPYDEKKIRKEYNLTEAIEDMKINESSKYLDKGSLCCDRCGKLINCRDAYVIVSPEHDDIMYYVCDKCVKGDDDILRKPLEHISEDLLEAAKHDNLNPDIWENNEMKPEVKEKLLEVVDKFKENLENDEIELDVKDIVLIGSNANYNYTEHSDLDLHIVADTSVYEDKDDLAMKCYQAYKTLFNNKYDPTIYGHEVEIYVEPDEIKANSNGMYSLYNGWIKEPVKTVVPEYDQKQLDELMRPYVERFNSIETAEDADNLLDDLYLQRQNGILKDGEYSIQNQVFKEFRNAGYLDKLKDKKAELESKDMSLENLNIEQIDEDFKNYKGYAIEHNFYGEGEYTVQVDGDDYWFDSAEEAKKFIDELPDDHIVDIHDALELLRNEEKLEEAVDYSKLVKKRVADYDDADWSVETLTDGENYYFNKKQLRQLSNFWSEDWDNVSYIRKTKNGYVLHDGLQSIDLPIEQVDDDIYLFPEEWNWVEVNGSLEEELVIEPIDMNARGKHYCCKISEPDGTNNYYESEEDAKSDLELLNNYYGNSINESDEVETEFGKDYRIDLGGKDLIGDRDTGDRQVEQGINWIWFSTDNERDAHRWFIQLTGSDEDYPGQHIIAPKEDGDKWQFRLHRKLDESYVIAITDYDPDQITYVGGDDAEHSANGEVNIKDALKFASKEEAQKWIDEMNRAYDEAPGLSRLTYEIQKLDEAAGLGDLDSPEEKDRQKRVFKQFAQKEADKKYQAEYEKHPSKWDIRADKVNEDLAEDKAHALANHLGYEKDSMVDSDDNQIFTTYDDSDYLVLTEDEAHGRAVDEIKMIWDDLGMESFTPNFQKWILDNAVDKEWFDQWIEENNKEAEENNEPEDKLSADDSIQMFRDIFGDEEFSKIIEEKDLVDLDKVAEEAISQDGVAHFISYYDGKEIDLGNGLFAYRIN